MVDRSIATDGLIPGVTRQPAALGSLLISNSRGQTNGPRRRFVFSGENPVPYVVFEFKEKSFRDLEEHQSVACAYCFRGVPLEFAPSSICNWGDGNGF